MAAEWAESAGTSSGRTQRCTGSHSDLYALTDNEMTCQETLKELFTFLQSLIPIILITELFQNNTNAGIDTPLIQLFKQLRRNDIVNEWN